MANTVFYTIVSASYLKQALATIESIKINHKDFDFYIYVIDLEEEYKFEHLNLHIISLHSLVEKFPEIEKFNLYYNVIETICALKPFIAKFLLNDYKVIIYGDSDTFFFTSIDTESELLKMGGFTPHRIYPSSLDNLFGNSFDISIIKFGFFNLGFFIILEKDLEFLTWWMEKLVFDCLYAPELFIFVDQKWIDLGIHYFGLNSIKNDSINIGPWNLDERIITKENDFYLANGKNIIMVHFSGVTESSPSGHIVDFYPPELHRSSILAESLKNYVQLSLYWLNQQSVANDKYYKIIKEIQALKKVEFSRLSFFERTRIIKVLKSGKILDENSSYLVKQIKRVSANLDKFMAKLDTYKYGRAYVLSDFRRIRNFFNRTAP